MPSIPMGQGRRIAPRPATPYATGAAVGVESGRALQQFGQAAADFAITDMTLDARERAHQDQQRQRLQSDAERAQGLAALSSAKVQLREGVAGVADRVLRGDLDDINARAEWDDVRGRVLSEATRDLPKHVSDPLGAEIKRQAAELASAELGRASEARSRGVARAGLMSALEGYEREAIQDRPKYLQMAQNAIERIGPTAGMGPEEQFKAMQGLRERTAYGVGDRLLLESGRSIQQLEQLHARLGGEEFADLSPERRQTLHA